MKIILVLLDGLGDRSYEILNHRTPLQAAATPNLDRLARLGSNGLFHAAVPGQCLPSENAHYLLFGYDLKDFPGRGLLEAVGEGVAFDDSDVLCLAHVAGVTWQKSVPILTQGRDDIEGDAEEIGEFFFAISSYGSEGINFRLHQTRRNDAILVLNGQASPYVSDSDPIVVGRTVARIVPLRDNAEPEAAARTAKALNAYLTHCHRVLTDHDMNRLRGAGDLPPANFLVTQRCGRRVRQEPFNDRWGLSGMLIASPSVYGGLARELGLTFVKVRDTEDPGGDLRERIRLALDDDRHDFCHVHTKVPDETAHKGGPEDKKAAITALDEGLDELLGVIQKREDLLVALTADHSTPCISTLIHSGEPVPVTIVGPNVRRDDVVSFDEISAAKGCLGFLRGPALMSILLNYADRSSFMNHQLGNRKRPYVPRDYEPFRLTD
jgi:2,3-bisphosphoglycerate-independent phosphoglycerate mutase